MAKNQFAEPHFHDEDAARLWFEAARWPNGPVCPKCGSAKFYATKKLGRYRCGASVCRKDFTVMTGTVMERSHAKLTQWAAAFHLGASSKKGFSAHQLHRELGCPTTPLGSCITASWKLCVVVALICRPWAAKAKWSRLTKPTSVTAGKSAAENENERSSFQPKPESKGKRDKRTIIALVERGGEVRSFHVPSAASR